MKKRVYIEIIVGIAAMVIAFTTLVILGMFAIKGIRYLSDIINPFGL